MNRVVKILENDRRRWLIWIGLIIIFNGIWTVLLEKPWEMHQSLLAIFLVFILEIGTNYFLRNFLKKH